MDKSTKESRWNHSIVASSGNEVITVNTRRFDDDISSFLPNHFNHKLNKVGNRFDCESIEVTKEQIWDLYTALIPYQQYKEVEFAKACMRFLQANEHITILTLTFNNN